MDGQEKITLDMLYREDSIQLLLSSRCKYKICIIIEYLEKNWPNGLFPELNRQMSLPHAPDDMS